MPATPYILAHNYLDTGVLYPSHVVTTTGTEVAGSELFRIADNLRDLTRFTVSETNVWVSILLNTGTAKTTSTLVLDKGHNLAGRSYELRTSADGVTYETLVAAGTFPASAGGLPSDAGGCLTPEGVIWKTVAPFSARWIALSVLPMGAGLTPVFTGVYLGLGYRFPAYLPAPGAYDYRSQTKALKNATSQTGGRIKRRILAWDEVDLRLSLEEADFAALLPHVHTLMKQNHPWWFCLDDSDAAGAGLMRLFQLPGDTLFDPIVNPVHRELRFLLEEVAPTVSI